MHDSISRIPAVEQEYAMGEDALEAMRSWFGTYTERFRLQDPRHQHHLTLKVKHSLQVCGEILDLAKSIGLNRSGQQLAEAIALLHDVGRFEQYRRHQTFADFKSEDHAALGANILRAEGVLSKLDPGTRSLILHAVSCHNKAELPPHNKPEYMLFAQLVRDADKLDILRIVLAQEYGELGLGLSREPAVADAVVDDILAGRLVKAENLKTLNDFKILQMGWIYDINFPLTFQRIKQREYLGRIYQSLPRTDQTALVYQKVSDYLSEQCRLFAEPASQRG
jgi:putative nucleotidyltransferase with HDIG domain